MCFQSSTIGNLHPECTLESFAKGHNKYFVGGVEILMSVISKVIVLQALVIIRILPCVSFKMIFFH